MEQKQAAVTNDAAVKSASVAREPSPQQSFFHDAPFYFLQRLHGEIGNRATGRWLQAKLRVGAINDPYEQEADRVADLVMRMPQQRGAELGGLGAGQVLQRCSCGGTCSSCTALQDERPVEVQRLAIASVAPSWIQREATESCSVKEEATSPEEAKEDAEAEQLQPGEEAEPEDDQPEGKEQQTQVQPKRHAAPAVSVDDIEERLNASRGQGEPLAPDTRQMMEDRFGYDFSRVRIHNAAYANRLNQDLNALAFTTGTDIYFAPSQFQPGTPAGQHLLAHELTHVVQQAGGGGGMVREKAATGMISRQTGPEDKSGLFGYYRTLTISGEYVHYRIERILRNNDDQLVTEAAIPGANRFEPRLNLIGVADLYKSEPAKTVTGVKGFHLVEQPSDIVAMDNPTAVGTQPGVTSSPTISGRRDAPVRTWHGDFPQKIWLGEIKPLSRSKAAAGFFQLDQYKKGYEAFVDRISKISRSTRSSIAVERLQITLPPFLDFDNWATQHLREEPRTTISPLRLWVANVGNGLYVYFAIDKGLTGPPTNWSKEVEEMRKIKGGLGGGKHPRTDPLEKMAQGRFLPGGPRLAPPRPKTLSSAPLIQRSTKDRPDNYWKERGREWEEQRSKWGKAFRAALKGSYRSYGQKLKIEKKLGRSSRSAPAAEKSEVREYKQLMFWSGLPGRFLGKIRFLLGTAWDKIIAIFERMKERMRDLRKKVFGTSEEGTFAVGWRKTLIKILVKAAKVAVIKFITESFNFFVQCFESAMDKVWEKIQGELHERFAEELCKARKFFEESKQRLEDEWGVSLDKLKELLTIIQDAKHWVDVATGLIQLIRLGVQVISCLSPPALGCLWGLVAQIGIGSALDLLIGTQWFNDNILSPTIGKLVRTYATPYYQKLINRALGDNLKEYHCHIADEQPSSAGFGGVSFNDGLREGSPDLLQHRDNWEAQNREAMTKDLQVIFQKGKGRKVTAEELQQLAEELKKASNTKTPEELKKLLEAARDPLTGRLKIEVAQENVKRGELPEVAEGEGAGKERKIDYPYATRRNKEYQRTLHWDPMTFYKKPGVAVDSEEFADAVYDMQEALRIDKDGILGEQTLLAFYDRNKLKPDAAYEAATKLKEEKQAAREKAAREKAAKEKKDTEEGGDLVAIGVTKPPSGTEIRGDKYPYELQSEPGFLSIPFGTSEPDIKEGETHAPGEELTIDVRYWIEHQWVWFTRLPVKLRGLSALNQRRILDYHIADDFYFKLTADATIVYIFSKGDKAIFLDPGHVGSRAQPSEGKPGSASQTPLSVQKLQRKLRVGAPDDPYEQEADRVADRVMRMALPPPEKRAVFGPAGPVVQRECASCGEEEELQRTNAAHDLEVQVQRACAACEEEEQAKEGVVQRQCQECGEEEELQRQCADCEETEPELQRKEAGSAASVAPPIVHDVLSSSGRPLDTATREFMEPRFGQDFSRVKIHTDDDAARSARAVNALAYTVGSDVVFDANRYNPGNREGRRLLAHELTHVVQQNGQRARTPASPSGVVQRAISKELDQIEDYLSYGLFDWAITEDEAKKALDLLKTLPKYQQAAFFSSQKYAGRLRSHLPAARLPELNAVETAVADFTPSRAEIAAIDSNLSYGLFDWVITDREAIESLEKLKKLPVQQLAVALAVIRYDRLMDNLPAARKPELAELSKLASQVNVKDVEPRAAARKTKGQIFGVPPVAGMTLSEFRDYTQQQADWFVEPTLTGPDRDALWGLLLHAEEGPHILSGVGDLQVTDLRAVAVGDWAPLARFCAGTHAEGHTIRIFPPLPALADRIELGKTLTSLEASIPGPVLEVTASQIQLEKVQTDGLAPKLAAYWTDYQPHIEQTFTPAPAARGPEFERVITFLNALGGPGLAALAPLRGPTPDERWVRNLHRFPLPMLNKLVANLGDTTGAKRLILVLHTGHDAPAAFQDAASLFSDLVLTSPGNLVLMIEGATSLAAITARIPTITATWGQLVGGVRKISQVVIAGHGSTQTVGMAGTSAPTVSPEGNVQYTEQSLVKGDAATEALLKALLHNMDPASARILYAGCLVGATDVPAGTAAAAIPGALAAQQSLGARTEALAPGEGIPAGRVQAARASVALANITSLFDPGTGDIKATYPFDPNAFGSASDYAQTGHEPEGVLRAAVEVGAVSTATAETLLRTRLTMPAIVDDWYDIVTRLLVGLALPPVVGAGVDLKKVNELANIADTPFLVLWDQFNITPADFKSKLNPQVFAADVYSGIAATVYYTAPVAHDRQRMRVVVDQGWLALGGAAQAPRLLAGILVTALGANVLKRYLDKSILKPQVAALLPSVGVPTSEQLTLALAWFDLDNADADVKSFLLTQVLHPANAPAALNPALHAVATAAGRTDRDVLDQLGFTAAAVAAPPVGGGAALPLANLALPDSAAMNRILVTGKPHLAHVVVPTASVRLEPAALRPPFTTLASGASVNVMGSVGDYRAVDAGGRLGFIDKAEISPP